MFHTWEGIVLKSFPYSETHKIVTIFTKEAGKLAAMARGASKPSSKLAAMTQPFVKGQFLLRTGRGMATLHQAEMIDSQRHIRSDLTVMAYASYLVELIDKLTEEYDERTKGVYTLLNDALHALNEGESPGAITLFVEWQMLPVAGIQPQIHCCASCGSTEGAFSFSFQQIGFLCEQCVIIDPHAYPLHPGLLRLIRTMSLVPIHEIGTLHLKQETIQLLQRIVRTIYDEQVGVWIKSRKFLEQLDTLPPLSGQSPHK